MDKENYALSNLDVEKIARKNIKMILNPDVHKCRNLMDLFRFGDYVLYNYLTMPNFGHWCALFLKRDSNKKPQKLFYFDSYGFPPDETLLYIPKRFREESEQNYPHLLKLIEESTIPLSYNSCKLQKKAKNIATCGRWAGLFLKYCDEFEDVDEFGDLFNEVAKMGYDKDKAITSITNKYILKDSENSEDSDDF